MIGDHERIERAALNSLFANCPPAARMELGLFVEDVEDARLFGARHEPSTLLNRTIGLSTGVRAMLESASLTRVRGWMTFQRDSSPCLERLTDLRIERVGGENAEHFGRVATRAFGLSERTIPLLAGLVHDSSWRLFVSYEGDQPAGTGALFVSGSHGWLDWAATDVRFRRRGSQGAIISHRIRVAAEAGCTTLFTETGEADARDPQHSYRNLKRYGFEEAGLRENWAPG